MQSNLISLCELPIQQMFHPHELSFTSVQTTTHGNVFRFNSTPNSIQVPPVWKRAVHLFTASAYRKLLSIYVFSYFHFGFKGRMWDLIVSVPDQCLSFYLSYTYSARPFSNALKYETTHFHPINLLSRISQNLTNNYPS